MNSRLGRRIVAVAAGAALIGLGALTAGCGKTGKEAPSSTTTKPTTTATSPPAPTSSAPAAPAPTEKTINPTGGNLFTPGVVAPPAQTVPPGQHPGIGGVS
jgi:hypothetical protein